MIRTTVVPSRRTRRVTAVGVWDFDAIGTRCRS